MRVFFYDILIYTSSTELHVKHLEQVLSVLRANQLPNFRKCDFSQKEMQYLRHVISEPSQVCVHKKEKVECMLKWPTPTNIRSLRGFLGLTGYYRRFVKGYSLVAKPSTNLSKRRNYVWSSKLMKLLINSKVICQLH